MPSRSGATLPHGAQGSGGRTEGGQKGADDGRGTDGPSGAPDAGTRSEDVRARSREQVGAAGTPSALLASKTAVPALPGWLIPGRAWSSGSPGVRGPLTVVAGPVGAGKSVLVAEWAHTGRAPARWPGSPATAWTNSPASSGRAWPRPCVRRAWT
ncbi:hypothetical protein NKH77_27535 [Streptomyces sp. M19]